jgi:hypothetical protein
MNETLEQLYGTEQLMAAVTMSRRFEKIWVGGRGQNYYDF